jgi:pimeloyl-ACP methyl ester carboxylesterase
LIGPTSRDCSGIGVRVVSQLLQHLSSPLVVESISIGGIMVLVYRLLHPALVASLKPRVSIRVQLRTFIVTLAYVAVLLAALLAIAWITRLPQALR